MENQVKVGDIFERTGGYNCSNTYFVMIKSISKTGKKAIVNRVGKTQVDGDWMNGHITANMLPEDEDYNFMIKKSKYNNEIVLRGATICGIETWYKWNGQPIWNNCD